MTEELSKKALEEINNLSKEVLEELSNGKGTEEEENIACAVSPAARAATYTNSSLVNHTHLSPNCNSPRNNTIKKITIHHMAGNLSVETCGNVFAPTTRQASSNYGIGSDGRVGLYVEERDRAWTSSSPTNDNQAITIEVANEEIGGNWRVSNAAYKKLIELCVDICKRNGISQLVWNGTTSGTLTCHYMFKATTCPGPYLKNQMAQIAKEVNEKLNPAPIPAPIPTPTPTPIVNKISVTYQTWDDVKNKWLPNVKDTTDYAGIFGHDVCAVYANLSSGNITYMVHTKGGKWLPAVTNRTDYAGLYNKPIDAIAMKTDTGKTIHYQVHIRDGKWLPYVTGYNTNDSNNGYAGILGKAIDGLRIYVD